MRRSDFIEDLSATGDGSRRHPESGSFVGAGEYGRRMESCISGGHADFQDAAGSQFLWKRPDSPSHSPAAVRAR